ncbi:1-phosphofructokinase [Bacillus sp. UMB0893]|uniref:1-phosphofructokinase n=1 Tax=Bacillus sp. UMB0893 TaxID=2066053 RepID=UPI000C75724B|nr:1-phosphofructokinase [Bacillus sp. UMB0893]PLR66061.1 1-phosphofructokinase [Bacillus sp. UMB0893]QNG60712.1 1-phosphofructokinase [Bacillus sp. PAMC26568]
MIYTCTLNPSIDYVVKVNNFKEGHLNRTESANVYPGGKGINVSRVLKRLGTENTALGFAGGFTGQFIKEFLSSEGITHDFIDVSDLTRINVKLKSNEETEINGQGPVITEEQKSKLLQKIDSLNADDVLVLAGSIPSALEENFYEKIAAKCRSNGVKVVIDTSGNSLRSTFSSRPFLIKPNHHELGELFETQISTVEEAVHYGRKLIEEGVQNIIVSMAEKGAVFMNDNQAYFANVPIGNVKNSVGSGDSVVAGFIAGFMQHQDYQKAFQKGVASGSATAFSEDLCTKEYAEQLINEINVIEI